MHKMAFSSKCGTQDRDCLQRALIVSLMPSIRLSLGAWAWDYPSAVRSSMLMAAACGRVQTCPAGPSFSSRYLFNRWIREHERFYLKGEVVKHSLPPLSLPKTRSRRTSASRCQPYEATDDN